MGKMEAMEGLGCGRREEKWRKMGKLSGFSMGKMEENDGEFTKGERKRGRGGWFLGFKTAF